MNRSVEVEIEGKTTQDAIKNALKILGAKRNQVEIKILSEGVGGLFGMCGSKSAKVRVALKKKS